MENDLARLMRSLRFLGVITLLVAVSGLIVRAELSCDVLLLALLCMASVGAACLVVAHRLRKLLRLHTSKDPALF